MILLAALTAPRNSWYTHRPPSSDMVTPLRPMNVLPGGRANDTLNKLRTSSLLQLMAHYLSTSWAMNPKCRFVEWSRKIRSCVALASESPSLCSVGGGRDVLEQVPIAKQTSRNSTVNHPSSLRFQSTQT